MRHLFSSERDLLYPLVLEKAATGRIRASFRSGTDSVPRAADGLLTRSSALSVRGAKAASGARCEQARVGRPRGALALSCSPRSSTSDPEISCWHRRGTASPVLLLPGATYQKWASLSYGLTRNSIGLPGGDSEGCGRRCPTPERRWFCPKPIVVNAPSAAASSRPFHRALGWWLVLAASRRRYNAARAAEALTGAGEQVTSWKLRFQLQLPCYQRCKLMAMRGRGGQDYM